MPRLSVVFLCALLCAFAPERAAEQTLKPQDATSAATGSVENIDVRSETGHLTIAIAMSSAVIPTSSRASNPDRLIFDFAGCELKGGNRRIAVNSGVVKELRASQFSAHPPIARVVLESKEPLNFELKPAGKGHVVIEIPLGVHGSATVAAPPSAEKKATAAAPPVPRPESPKHLEPSSPSSKPTKSINSPPGAYALLEKARGLGLVDLQPVEDRAKAGNPEAQTLLALAYHAGALLKKDDVEAARLLHLAADRGYPAAEESLGIFAETGIGLDHASPAEALNWYKKAAEKGSIDAATDIALLYANGKGVPRDPEQAVHWFRLNPRSSYRRQRVTRRQHPEAYETLKRKRRYRQSGRCI